MRLIDAELLEEQFGISDADILAKEEIRYAPTVDAVVVTRCKDCKHSRETADGRGLFCSVWGRGWHWVQPDGFCNYGKYQTNGGADHEDD